MIPVEEIREPPGKAMGKVAEGQVVLCGIRGVHEGKLWLYVYGRVITGHVDPIEKKPVSHYRPGSKIFSIATTGCNWLCRYCFVGETTIHTNTGILSIQSLFEEARPTANQEVRLPEGLAVVTH